MYRASQLNVGWTEKQVKQMDPLAPEGDTNHATKEEKERYKQIWMLKGNTDGYAREGTSHINRITVLLFKKNTKSHLQILPHLPTSQDPNRSRSDTRSSGRVVAFDCKKIQTLIEQGDRSCAR